VSAWVNYQPGKDGTGATGIDSGRFTVQALSFIAGKDSIVGVGIATIPPTGGTWIQATATIVYTAYGTTPIDTMRITFTSSRGIGNLDSSTLYVDDLSMTSQPQSVAEVSGKQVANVYPNPANGSLYIDGTYSAEATITLIAANGQVVTTKTLTGKDVIDLTALPSGIYCYTIADKISGVLQNGKVNVTK
jgi:hypothetical protein